MAMDETLLDFPESRMRTIFGRCHSVATSGSATAAAATSGSSSDSGKKSSDAASTGVPADAVDPLYPSLDTELPQVYRPVRQLYRPPWDPRERWRQLRPTQPYYAPPESDLPGQFRYEDLSVYEKSETMDVHEDRLLRWLVERFESGLEYKHTAAAGDSAILKLAGEQAIKQQVFTELQVLDEQLSNLGLSSTDPALIEQRRRLLEQRDRQQAQVSLSVATESESVCRPTKSRSSGRLSGVSTAAGAAAAASSRITTSTGLSLLDELDREESEDENETEEFGAFASPSLAGGGLTQTTQTVVTVHEASWQPQPSNPRRSRKHRQTVSDWAGGDAAMSSGGDTIECEVNIRPNWGPAARATGGDGGHRVQQFGDAATCESGYDGIGGYDGSGKRFGHRNVAEEEV